MFILKSLALGKLEELLTCSLKKKKQSSWNKGVSKSGSTAAQCTLSLSWWKIKGTFPAVPVSTVWSLNKATGTSYPTYRMITACFRCTNKCRNELHALNSLLFNQAFNCKCFKQGILCFMKVCSALLRHRHLSFSRRHPIKVLKMFCSSIKI